MNEGKSQVNILDGLVSGFSAFIGMTVERIFFGEQSFLIRVLLVVMIAVMTALCWSFAIKIFRKSRIKDEFLVGRQSLARGIGSRRRQIDRKKRQQRLHDQSRRDRQEEGRRQPQRHKAPAQHRVFPGQDAVHCINRPGRE